MAGVQHRTPCVSGTSGRDLRRGLPRIALSGRNRLQYCGPDARSRRKASVHAALTPIFTQRVHPHSLGLIMRIRSGPCVRRATGLGRWVGRLGVAGEQVRWVFSDWSMTSVNRASVAEITEPAPACRQLGGRAPQNPY